MPQKKAMRYFTPKFDAVKVYPDGRQVCANTAAGKREYKTRTAAMWVRQKGHCALCGYALDLKEATFDHEDGRGMGGGHRDDRIVKDGKPYNAAVCGLCNGKKGSVRMSKYKQDAHVPVQGTKRIVRSDTGELVREMAMTPSEMQEKLFADDAKDEAD